MVFSPEYEKNEPV